MEPNSPAALAGLQEHLDFIVGADQVLQDVRCVLFNESLIVIQEKTNLCMQVTHNQAMF